MQISPMFTQNYRSKSILCSVDFCKKRNGGLEDIRNKVDKLLNRENPILLQIQSP